MAQTVEVELELDSQGVVQSVNAAGESFERLDEAETDAAEGAEKYEDAAEGAAEASERQAQANRDAAQAAERNEQAQREAAQQAQRYAAASDRMAAGAGSANEVLFSTGDAIQDVQFGIAGAANNVAFIAENFAQLQRQAGGTKGAFSALTSSLTGTAGFILALQALLALGPQLAQWFSSREDEAEGLADALDSAAENLLSFQEDIRGFEVASLEDAKETRDILEQQLNAREAELDRLQRILRASRLTEGVRERVMGLTQEQFQALKRAADLQESSTAGIAAAVEAKREERNAAKSSVKQAENLIQSRRANLMLADALNRARQQGADLTRENAEEAEKLSAEAADGLKTIEALSVTLTDLQNQQLRPGLQLDGDDRVLSSLAGISAGLEQGGFRSISMINDSLAVLDRKLKQATSPEKRQRIKRLQQALRGLKTSMATLSDEGVRFGQIIGQGVANALTSAAQEIGSGGDALKAVAQTLGQLFQRLGKAMIAYGIGLKAIKTLNPAVAIIGGAGLVAAGAALSSAVSDTQSAIGGPGQGQSTNVQDGGEASVNTDVPGRRMGGPVQAGGLYETHGLGQREFFVPATDGAIVTRGQARGRRMDVRQQTDVNLDVTEPDLFDLRAALNETSDIVEEKF